MASFAAQIRSVLTGTAGKPSTQEGRHQLDGRAVGVDPADSTLTRDGCEQQLGTLRSRRLEAGLSRAALALRSGVSASTIRNIETGRHLPTTQTLAAIAAVLPCSDAGYSLIGDPKRGILDGEPVCLVGMDDGIRAHLQLMHALSGEGGYLPPSLLLSDPACAAAFCEFRNRTVDAHRQSIVSREVAQAIRRCVGRNPLDVWAIACADGRKEVALCEWLLAAGLGCLRLLLVEQSLPLLTSAYRHASHRLGTERDIRWGGLQADLTQLPHHRLSQHLHRQLFCLIGPQLGLLDSELLILRQALVHAQKNDLLLLGFDVSTGDPWLPQALVRKEPLLQGADVAHPLLRAFVERPFRLYLREMQGLRLGASLDVTSCAVPSSYAVELRATVTTPARKPRRYSLWRSKRYQPQALQNSLHEEGWELVRQWQDDEQTPAAGLHLYQRVRVEEPCASDGPGSFQPVAAWRQRPLWSDDGSAVCQDVLVHRQRRLFVTLCRTVSQLRCQPVPVRSPESARSVGKRLARLAYLLL